MLKNSVRMHRANRGLSQSALGEQSGVTRQTVAFIEKGEYSPSVALALRLAHVLDVSITELFWLEENKK